MRFCLVYTVITTEISSDFELDKKYKLFLIWNKFCSGQNEHKNVIVINGLVSVFVNASTSQMSEGAWTQHRVRLFGAPWRTEAAHAYSCWLEKETERRNETLARQEVSSHTPSRLFFTKIIY